MTTHDRLRSYGTYRDMGAVTGLAVAQAISGNTIRLHWQDIIVFGAFLVVIDVIRATFADLREKR